MTDKTCIITGATSGIGEVAARELARAGADVVLVARSAAKGKASLEAVTRETGSDRVRLLLADLSSQDQIRRLAGEILAECPQIDVLLNNAGVTNLSHSTTTDGIETVFAVNHLAYFLLTGLLLERIAATPAARVVNVASEAHRFSSIQFDDLGFDRTRYRWMRVYGQSKLANILFTRELARRLENRGVSANCLHPGAVSTGLGSNNGRLFKWVAPLLRPFMKSPAKGAETSLYLCTSPEVAGVTGHYFARCREKTPSREARDDEIAARLWQRSAELTGLDPSLGAA